MVVKSFETPKLPICRIHCAVIFFNLMEKPYAALDFERMSISQLRRTRAGKSSQVQAVEFDGPNDSGSYTVACSGGAGQL